MSANIGTLRSHAEGSSFRLLNDIHASSAPAKPTTILEAVQALQRTVDNLVTMHQRQARQHRSSPAPERRTQSYREMDATFQAEHGGTATIAQRISREIQARGLANAPTLRSTSGAPTPDMSQSPIDLNEMIIIGPDMWQRRKDIPGYGAPAMDEVSVKQRQQAAGARPNGRRALDPRTADIIRPQLPVEVGLHKALTRLELDQIDAAAVADGLSIRQRMQLELVALWNSK